ncbi:AI-2E family transporter [Aquirhabdus parva]|uniref:AI-2E family transporter n=1 Tax=Aquirhabdus parva TaxID=2283318 RepID=A0A345P2Y4_9GAMM|nr:AI-2E family transporter [Aquirhabdus parva]AXI01643.1 AI-2E family transporter [Aquirhabdus parva]
MSRPALISTLSIQRMLLPILLGILVFFSFEIVRIFISPIAWAAILVYITWPLYQWTLHKFSGRESHAAGIVTAGLMTLVGVPIGIAFLVTEHQAVTWYHQLHDQLNAGQLVLPTALANLPWVGSDLQDMVDQLNDDPSQFITQLRSMLQDQVGKGARLVGNVAEHIASVGFCLITMFFFYKDGLRIMVQIRAALERIVGVRGDHYLSAIAVTTRAVVYGIVLTAAAQGLLAGIGYAVAGMPGALLLAVITAIVAMIPFASPLAWGLAIAWLAITGHPIAAVALAVWAGAVIFIIDNILRPMVISSATAIPFLVVLFGVLGGLATFGMIGLFIGPVILAMLLAVWREWLTHEHEQQQVIASQNTVVVEPPIEENKPS